MWPYNPDTIRFAVLRYVILQVYSVAFPYIRSVLPVLLCNISRNVRNCVTRSDMLANSRRHTIVKLWLHSEILMKDWIFDRDAEPAQFLNGCGSKKAPDMRTIFGPGIVPIPNVKATSTPAPDLGEICRLWLRIPDFRV